MDYGPFDLGMESAPKRIKLGIVGTADTVEGAAHWIEACRTGFAPKESRQPNLFPAFPGAGIDSTFRCEFFTSEELQRVLPPREVARLAAIPGQREMTRAVTEVITDEISALSERTVRPDVVLVALPVEIIERTFNARDVPAAEGDDLEAGADLDFRGMLKAACMRQRLPIPTLVADHIRSELQDFTKAQREYRAKDPRSGYHSLESSNRGLLQSWRLALAFGAGRTSAPHLVCRSKFLPPRCLAWVEAGEPLPAVTARTT